MTDKIRHRPKRGTMDGEPLLLRLPELLREHADKAAAKAQLTLSEWIRQAIAKALKANR